MGKQRDQIAQHLQRGKDDHRQVTSAGKQSLGERSSQPGNGQCRPQRRRLRMEIYEIYGDSGNGQVAVSYGAPLAWTPSEPSNINFPPQ